MSFLMSSVSRLSRHTTSFMDIFQILLYKGKLLHIHWLDFIWLPQSMLFWCFSVGERITLMFFYALQIDLSFQVCCDMYSYTIHIVTFELVGYFPECDLLPLSTTISKNLQRDFFNFVLHNCHSLIKCCLDAFDL